MWRFLVRFKNQQGQEFWVGPLDWTDATRVSAHLQLCRAHAADPGKAIDEVNLLVATKSLVARLAAAALTELVPLTLLKLPAEVAFVTVLQQPISVRMNVGQPVVP